MTRKIHFINRLDRENCGDWNCSPLPYYFSYFSQYDLLRHDIDFIDFNEIQPEDVVILGGSGMLHVTRSFDENICRVLARCRHVVGWSLGFNTHRGAWAQGTDFPEIPFDRFSLLTIRDVHHPSGIEHCADPSCLHPALGTRADISRTYGVIEHKDLPLSLDLGADTMKNNRSIEEIADFIAHTETILTNSWHVAYWTQLMERKCILVNAWSTKFDFMYPPPGRISTKEGHVDTQELDAAAAAQEIPHGLRARAIAENQAFFTRVQALVDACGITRGSSYQTLYLLSHAALWNTQAKLSRIDDLAHDTQHAEQRINDLHDEIYGELHRLEEALASEREETRRLAQALQRKLTNPFARKG